MNNEVENHITNNNNHSENSKQLSKRSLYIVLFAAICLLLSLTVFYPLAMKVDRYGNDTLRILSYSFYIFQGIAFMLTIAGFINGISCLKREKNTSNYFTLIVSIILFVVFGYEIYWVLTHI